MYNQNVVSNNNELSNIKTNKDPEIQVDDYVIAMCKNPVTLSKEHHDSPASNINVEVGILFKVVGIRNGLVILEEYNNGFLYDIIQLRRCPNINLIDGLYVLKTNLTDCFTSNDESLYVIDRPEVAKDIEGSRFVYVTVTNDNPSSKNNLSPRKYEDLDVKRVLAKGYLAHVDCFIQKKAKPLFDLFDGNKEEYLGRKKSYRSVKN